MGFSPTITKDSKAFPGVSFTVRRIGFARRVEIDMDTLAYRSRQRELQLAYPSLSEREQELQRQIIEALKKAAAVSTEDAAAVWKQDIEPLNDELLALSPPEVQEKRRLLDSQFAAIDGFIRVAWIRSGLVSIAGGEFDGMTADQLLDYGPPELAEEIYAAIESDGKLTGEERKNSKSPTTSDVPVDGAITSTGASIVWNGNSGTVSGTTPSL